MEFYMFSILTVYEWTKLLKGRKQMFYLTTHSTHFLFMVICVIHMVKDHSDRESHYFMDYFLLAARVLLYEPSHRQDSTLSRQSYISF